MKHEIILLICFVMMLPLIASAQWTGFPMRANTATNSYDVMQVVRDYSPFSQLSSAVVERCQAAKFTPPSNIQNWTGLWAGTNRLVVTQYIGSLTNIYTNWITLTTNKWTTNTFGAFPYQYTDYSGAHTSTAWTYPTHDFLVAMDTAIRGLFAGESTTSPFIVKNFNDYITNRYTSGSSRIPADWSDMLDRFPNALIREQVGYVTNWTTNWLGIVQTAVRADFTSTPPTTNIYTLAQTANLSNNVWDFHSYRTNDTSMYDPSTPAVKYYAAGTNPFSAFNVTITGLVLNIISNQSVISTSELVTITGSNNTSTLKWWEITGITPASAPPNTGDCVTVTYTNTRAVYGAWAWDLSDMARDLDERYKVLNSLKKTYANANRISLTKFTNESAIVYISDTNTDEYASCWSTVSTIFNNSTNWVADLVDGGSAYGQSLEFNAYQTSSRASWDYPNLYYSFTFSSPKYPPVLLEICNLVGTPAVTNLTTNVAHTAQLYARDQVEMQTGRPASQMTNIFGFAAHPQFSSLSSPYYQPVTNFAGNTNSANISSNYVIIPRTNLWNLIPSTPSWPTIVPPNYDYLTNDVRAEANSWSWVIDWDFKYK